MAARRGGRRGALWAGGGPRPAGWSSTWCWAASGRARTASCTGPSTGRCGGDRGAAPGPRGPAERPLCPQTGELVALKKVPLRRPEEGLPLQTLREIKALREMEAHPNVIRLRAAFAQGPAVVLALELLVADLGGLLRAAPAPLPPARVRALLAMTLRGLGHLHGQRLLHRDLKPANLLLDSAGRLKLADFGLARLLSPTPGRPYSHQVATRAAGCILGELITLAPLFPGDTDLEQLCRVLSALGTPRARDWPELAELPDFPKLRFRPRAPPPLQLLVPGADAAALDLLQRLLHYCPGMRPRAQQALLHPFFFGPQELSPPPAPGGSRRNPNFSLERALELPPRGALGPLPELGTPPAGP
uniref:Cyclin-dependent kinase 20 n=1 Tax=Taeniopygia guttata TaxID=59729 RepID=A0A674HSJ0_TAEGU